MSWRSEPRDAAGPLLSGLGLARRAGQLRVGVDAVQRAIRKSEAVAVVIASDAPPQVQRRLRNLLSSHSLPHTVVLDGDQLGRAVGRERVVALAVTDKPLGIRVLELARALEG